VHDFPLKATRLPPLSPGALPPLPLLPDHQTGVRFMERWIRSQYSSEPLQILEAGCGNKWSLQLDVPYRLTAVDLDSNALSIRTTKFKDIDKAIVGDLRNREIVPEGKFDVIYNAFVLEHVDGAEQVLDNFFGWLKPGGLLILRIPDRDSVYGFLTRITPFWSHVALKRYVYRFPNAGKPGFDPYPTYYDWVVSRRGMRTYCEQHGHIIKDEAGAGYYLPPRFPLRTVGYTVVRTLSALSLGRLEWRHNNLTFVIQKNLKSQIGAPAQENQIPQTSTAA
jgi:SAM-dependent methyltransferase